MENYFGKNGLTWFIGVVEDRLDPEKMGRVRVRCLGHHSHDKNDIATEDLPWSTVMNPTTTPSMGGMGNTPPFIVEGSWVIGFFLDKYKQENIIIGTLPGFNATSRGDLGQPSEKYSSDLETSEGFKDPQGVYPVDIDNDVNKLARGSIGDYHKSFSFRKNTKIKDVPKATKPKLSTVESMPRDKRQTWDELSPKSEKYSLYPYNHVNESESGHIHEVDDTPGGERLMNYHKMGTFDEIHPDGSKVTKIVGSQYEITLKDKNVSIEGECNLTIGGSCRTLIKGDYVLEVEGDYTEKIHRNHYVKVGAGSNGGNEAFEIIGNRAGNISKTDNLRINEDSNTMCNGNQTLNINGDLTQTVIKNYSLTALEKMAFQATDDIAMVTINGNYALKSGSLIMIDSVGNYVQESGAEIIIGAVGNITASAARIDLN